MKAFSGDGGGELASFFAYGSFTGGVRVGAGDVNLDGRVDIITGAGPGGGPHLRAFDGLSNSELAGLFAFDGSMTGGIFVSGPRNESEVSLRPVATQSVPAAGQEMPELQDGGPQSAGVSVAYAQSTPGHPTPGLDARLLDRLHWREDRSVKMQYNLLRVVFRDLLLVDLDAAHNGLLEDLVHQDHPEFSATGDASADSRRTVADVLSALAYESGAGAEFEDLDTTLDPRESSEVKRGRQLLDPDVVDLILRRWHTEPPHT